MVSWSTTLKPHKTHHGKRSKWSLIFLHFSEMTSHLLKELGLKSFALSSSDWYRAESLLTLRRHSMHWALTETIEILLRLWWYLSETTLRQYESYWNWSDTWGDLLRIYWEPCHTLLRQHWDKAKTTEAYLRLYWESNMTPLTFYWDSTKALLRSETVQRLYLFGILLTLIVLS